MRQIIQMAALVVAAATLGCGGCGSEPSTPTHDMGQDDLGTADMATTDTSTDLGQPDAAPADAGDVGGDVGVACGNGTLDPGEACDNTVFRDDASCSILGLPAGTLACTDTCELDTTACAVCGDGICSDSETSASCVEDCGVKSIAAGRTHTCAVLADGSLWCWGAHDGHRMGGTPDTNVPVRLPGHDNVVQVAAGDHHTCFVDSTSTVWCFGASGFGEARSNKLDVFPPVNVMFGTKVATGANHSCAISSRNGDVYCWGRGDYGQRGDGTFVMRKAAITLITPQSAGTVDLQLGGNMSCEVLSSLRVRCWGDNTQGQLGTGYLDWENTPQVAINLFAIRLAGAGVGENHICFNAQAMDGSSKALACLGSNAYGQLGAEPSTDVLSTNGLAGEYTPVVAGFSYTCAVNHNDVNAPQLQCWGDNYFGQLGDGTLDGHFTPAAVVGIADVTALSGGHDHVCAILPDETARCWGRNREGQLGNGTVGRDETTPVVPVGLGPATGGTP